MGNTLKSNILVTLDGKQAEKMLTILTNKSETLKEEIRDLNKQRITAGLSPEAAKRFDALKKEFRETKKAIRETATQIADVSSTINRISSAPIKEIEKAIKAVTAQMKKLDRGTEQYAKRQKQLSVLKAELDRINGSGEKAAGTFGMIGKTMKRLASYVLVYAGFNELMAGLRKMYNMNVALSDQLTDIEKTTGISGQALAELSNDINKIDTRTSVEELNKLAIAAGKLGISGKQDVMEFVEAGNIINVALGEDLGEDAIKNIAKLNDVLGITKELGVEKSLLATGSAINELGQNSTASEGYLVDFAGRLGGVAKQAGLTMQQVLALASASDQLKLENEVAATAINKVLTTLLSKTGQVAKAIGVTKKELQDALNKDTWSGLMMIFDKLSEKGGLAAIAPLMGDLGSDGARLNAVISALSGNTDKLRQELDLANTSFAKGISVIDEYNKKNNNLAGTIEKIGKNIQHWFIGSGIVDWMLKVAQGIEAITRGVGTLDQRFENQKNKVATLSTDLRKLASEYERLESSNASEDQERLKQVIAEIVKVVPSAANAFDQYGNAISLSTKRINTFIDAQKKQLQVLNKELITETESEIKSTELTIARLKYQLNEISKNQGLRLLDPVSGQFYDASEKQIEKITTDYNEAVGKLDVLKKKLSDINGDFLEQEIIARRVAEIKSQIAADIKREQEEEKRQQAIVASETEEEAKARIKASNEAIDLWLQKRKNALAEARLAQQDANAEDYISQKEYNRALEALEIKALQKKLEILGLEPSEVAKIEGQILDIRRQFMEKTEQAQKKWSEEYTKLQEQLGIRTEDKDKRNLARINVLYDTLIQKAKEGVAANYQSQEQITEDIRKFEEQRQKAINAYWGEQDLKSMDENEAFERNSLREQFINREMDYEEYLRQVSALEEQYAESRLEISGLSESKMAELRIKYQDARFDAMKQAYDKEKALQKEYASVIESSLEGIGGAFAELASGSETAMQDMQNALIDTLFDSLTKMVDIWLKELDIAAAVNIAMGSAKEVGSKGLIGIATAALVSGAIHGFMQVAKAAIKSTIGGSPSSSSGSTGQRVVKTSGFDVGGYTGDGGTYEVAGLVHKGEYVVPKWLMQLPHSRMLVNNIEYIRQTQTSRNPLPRGLYADGGGVETNITPVAPSGVYADPQLQQTLNGILNLLDKLNTNGIQAQSVISLSNLEKQQERRRQSIDRGSLKKKS